MSASQFADEIGVQRSSVSHVLSGRNKPSLDFIIKIVAAFPEINSDWLLSGKGEILEIENVQVDEGKDSGIQGGLEFDYDEDDVIEDLSLKALESKIPARKTKTGSKRTATGSKTLDKIVFFYQDGTFSEYAPE